MQLGSQNSCYHRFTGPVPFPPFNRTLRSFNICKNCAHTVADFFCPKISGQNFHLKNSGAPYPPNRVSEHTEPTRANQTKSAPAADAFVQNNQHSSNPVLPLNQIE